MHHAPFRLLRTSLVGATILGLAAGAHLVAGGALPPAPIMAAILALHLMLTTFATKFRLSLPAMMALLLTSQLVLHQAFDALSHSAHAATPAAAGHGAMHTDAYTATMLAQATPLAGSTVEAMGHSAMSGTMTAAHLTASVLTAVLLAYGEHALWALANWLRPLYRRAAVVHVFASPNPGAAIAPRPLPRLPWRNLRPDTRRGPPRQSAVFS